MKSERRHELEHNELADWTVNVIEKIKPYTNVIVGGTIAVIILAIGIALWNRQARIESEAAWTIYYAGLNTKDSEIMQEIANDFPSTEAAQWAIVGEGDIRLRKGCRLLFIDKMSAAKELEAAIKCYQAVQGADDQMIAERATYGLARAYESQVDLKKAKETYEKQLESWEDGAYSESAKDRLSSLEKKSTKEFYVLFEQYEPVAKEQSSGVISGYEETEVPTPEDKSGEGVEVEEIDETVIVEPKVVEPKTEEAGTEQPKIEQPETEEPKVEEPKKEEPKKVAEPKMETPKEEPKKTE